MRQIFARIIFLSIILLLSFAINFYVLSRLCGLFRIKKGAAFWIFVLLCTVSLIGATIFRSSVDNIISSTLYFISAGWYGVLWLLFSTLIVYEILRFFLKIKPFTAGVLIITIVALATIYSFINAQFIHIKKLTIPGNTDLNVVQFYDIHLGSVSGNFLERVIDKTNTLNPDLILITGDLVDNHNKKTQKALEALKNLKAPTFFVTGNHERYVGPAKVINSLKAANVKALRNQLTNFGEIQIIGIDANTDKNNIEQVIQKLNMDSSRFCILISHHPVELETLSLAGVDLALSGHTHGGQIFPFNYVVRLSHKYLSGLYKHNGTYLYVTSGTGTWGPRMRLGSRSEIVLIKIKKAP